MSVAMFSVYMCMSVFAAGTIICIGKYPISYGTLCTCRIQAHWQGTLLPQDHPVTQLHTW